MLLENWLLFLKFIKIVCEFVLFSKFKYVLVLLTYCKIWISGYTQSSIILILLLEVESKLQEVN